jgi:hypothetical protein
MKGGKQIKLTNGEGIEVAGEKLFRVKGLTLPAAAKANPRRNSRRFQKTVSGVTLDSGSAKRGDRKIFIESKLWII